MTKFLARLETIPDRYFLLALIPLSILIRLPFLSAYDFVSYDGTYYINIARSLLDGIPAPGPFPVGYPLLIAPWLFFMDDVRAAQLVSYLASLGSLFVLFTLTRHLVGKREAVFAALLLSSTPAFVRYSMLSLSESSYVFWVLLSLFMYYRRRHIGFGLAAGMAAITRPEAIGIFAVLAAMRFRDGKRLGFVVVAFLAVYAINVAVLSKWSGHLVLLQKTENVGLSATDWKLREAFIDFEGREDIDAEVAKQGETASVVGEYVRRLPDDLFLLLKHATAAVVYLALFGMFKRRMFLLAAMVPFLIFPLFTPRSSERFILPYVPVLIMYALVGIRCIGRERLRRVAYWTLAAFAMVGFFVNMPLLSLVESAGFESTREAALQFGDRINRADRVADRKPFFAFYAGGTFTKLPAAPYEDTMKYLYDENVKVLSLHGPTIHRLRPSLQPLLYNRAVILGEMRYDQVYFRSTGEVLYQRQPRSDPLELTSITPADGGLRMSPVWSPDGRWIAFREAWPSGKGEIAVIAPDGEERRTVVTEVNVRDPISWGPNSRRIVFANKLEETMCLYTYDLSTGKLERLTEDEYEDESPNWSHDGREIAFSSNRSGQREIWIRDLATGTDARLTGNGGNRYPALSSDGTRVAFVRNNGSLWVLDRIAKKRKRIGPPRKAAFVPSWSPDGRFIAVAGEIWGGNNIYIARSDGSEALLLTKTVEGRAMPAWSPDGDRLVLITNEGDKLRLTIASGLEGYLERLSNPPEIHTFERQQQ
jgi:Tol biopolymer transport system component